METLWQDARYAMRSLGKRPGFSAVVILTFALGIGANTAIISLIYGILLRPFPYRDADCIVRVESVDTKTTGNIQGGSQLDLGDWQQHTRGFDAFGLYVTFPRILNTFAIGEADIRGRSVVAAAYCFARLFPTRTTRDQS